MDDDVSHDLAGAELGELARLRARAYSADADIADDPIALARLAELEDRVKSARDAAANRFAADTDATLTRARAVPTLSRRAHWQIRLVASAAVAAFVLTAAVVTGTTGTAIRATVPAAADAWQAAPWLLWSAGDDDAHIWPASPTSYNDNLDRLRQEALEGSNTAYEHDLRRLDIGALLPKGTIDGRSVWVGPGIDGVTCLVLGGDDGPIIGCATPAAVAERGLRVTAPPTPDITEAGPTEVRFTLAADGSVTSQGLSADGTVLG